jgi:hypothetical protein
VVDKLQRLVAYPLDLLKIMADFLVQVVNHWWLFHAYLLCPHLIKYPKYKLIYLIYEESYAINKDFYIYELDPELDYLPYFERDWGELRVFIRTPMILAFWFGEISLLLSTRNNFNLSSFYSLILCEFYSFLIDYFPLFLMSPKSITISSFLSDTAKTDWN